MKFGEVSVSDPRRATTLRLKRSLRLPPTATAVEILAAIPLLPGDIAVNGIAVGDGPTLPVRGAPCTVDWPDLNATFDALRSKISGAAELDAGVNVRFERCVSSENACSEWKGVADGDGVVALSQVDRVRVRVTAKKIVALRAGYRGRDCVTGGRWTTATLTDGAYLTCGGSAGEAIVESIPGVDGVDVEGMFADRVGDENSTIPALVVEVYPVRDFKVWIPKQQKLISPRDMHDTPRMHGVDVGDTVIFFGSNLGPAEKEMTIADFGMRPKDNLLVTISQNLPVRILDVHGSLTTVYVDLEFDCVGDIRTQAVEAGCRHAKDGDFMFAGRRYGEDTPLAKCGAYEMCEVLLIPTNSWRRDERRRGNMTRGNQLVETMGLRVDSFAVGAMKGVTLEVCNHEQFLRRTGRSVQASPSTDKLEEVAKLPLLKSDGRRDPTSGESSGGLTPSLLSCSEHSSAENLAFPVVCRNCKLYEATALLEPCKDALCASCAAGMARAKSSTAVGIKLFECPCCASYVYKVSRMRSANEGDGGETTASRYGSGSLQSREVGSGEAVLGREEKSTGKIRKNRKSKNATEGEKLTSSSCFN